MDNGSSPVQPLDSAGGTDPRLANMLASAKDAGGTQPATPAGHQAGEAVPAHLCPNCLNGRGVEVELEADDEKLVKTTGKCPECGFDASQRLYF